MLSQFWKSAISSLNGILLGSISDVILKDIMLLAKVNVNVRIVLPVFSFFVEMKRTFGDKFN